MEKPCEAGGREGGREGGRRMYTCRVDVRKGESTYLLAYTHALQDTRSRKTARGLVKKGTSPSCA